MRSGSGRGRAQQRPNAAAPGAKGGSASYALAATTTAPFTQEQVSWLRNAVADTMGTALERFGGQVDAELNIVRDGVAAARFEAAEAACAAASAKQLAAAALARMEQLT